MEKYTRNKQNLHDLIIKPRLFLFLKACYHTGARPSAVMDIQVKHFNQNIGAFDLAYRVSVYTMRRTAATKVYKKFGIVHAKRFLNHTEIDTTMKYLNIDDDMELIDYGL